MILAIDAGNSRVKWGWHDGSGWTSLATVSLIEFAASNHDINPFAATHANPERIIISNVAGEAAHQLIVNWTSIFEAEPHWLHGEAERCGVKSRYEAPEQLGPDRWAALVAARALHAGPCVVVNSGTATTIDVLAADGTFEGGLILPGVELMRFVLHEHTGRLPLEQGHFRTAPAQHRGRDRDRMLAGAGRRGRAHVPNPGSGCAVHHQRRSGPRRNGTARRNRLPLRRQPGA